MPAFGLRRRRRIAINEDLPPPFLSQSAVCGTSSSAPTNSKSSGSKRASSEPTEPIRRRASAGMLGDLHGGHGVRREGRREAASFLGPEAVEERLDGARPVEVLHAKCESRRC